MSFSTVDVDPLTSILDQMESDEEFAFDPPECLSPQFTADDLPSPVNKTRSADLESVSSHNSGTSSSDSKTRYLYPRIDTVEVLRPEEVRWFYKESGERKWTAFIGYDSLRLECKYREISCRTNQSNQCLNGGTEEEEEDDEKICVRGSLYEVDVVKRKCCPIYWYSEQTADVIRGTWFIDHTWQPVKEHFADPIEAEHLARFEHQKLPDEKAEEKIPKKDHISMHQLKLEDAYVEWNSISQVFLHRDNASSKFDRAVRSKLGLAKAGTKLRRGYKAEAGMDDKPPDICHLIFVTHGMGQKMEFGRIVKSCTELRNNCSRLRTKYFPSLDQYHKRCEFLPCEWRRDLKLDGDIVETITPNKVRDLRNMLNSSALDVLYYTSPLYRSEITLSLQKELNRLYSKFIARHPYFEASGGKVSIVAHSLGAVIVYDIVTGWNPIQLYDQYVNNVIDECHFGEERVESCHTAKSSAIVGNQIYFSLSSPDLEEMCNREDKGGGLLSELEKARKRVTELEGEILKQASQEQLKTQTLLFKLENFFLLGSPLAVFLALRGVRPKSIEAGVGTQDSILPKSLCSRIFNVFHPSDPVAYRLEPLVLKHYSSLMPLQIHRYQTPSKESYEAMQAKAYTAVDPVKGEMKEEVIKDFSTALEDASNHFDDYIIDDEEFETGISSKNKKKEQNENEEKPIEIKVPEKQSVGSGWGWGFRRNKKVEAPEGSELSDISPRRDRSKDRKKEEVNGQDDWVSVDFEPAPEQTELENRMDFVLKEGKMESAYLSALTSHTSYWNNMDVAFFLLDHIFPNMSVDADSSS